MNNYWLIPMDFETCNFQQMEEEWKNNKKIMWQVPGTPKEKKKDEWFITTNMAKSINQGDIVYFYVSHLPSESKQNLSRVILRGIIEEEPYPIEYNKVYWESDDTKMISGFSIGSITTLSKEQLENNLFLSYEHLRSIYNNFLKPQGKNWPDKNYKSNFSEEVIDVLENNFKQSLYKDDFKTLINHFNQKCFFCNKYGNKSDHRTFIRKNGIDYYEYHHFIPQYKAKQIPELKGIIDAPANGLYLCSNCHNKFHYGRIEDVNEMIGIVLEDEKIQKMLNEFSFKTYIDETEDIFEWFKDTYNTKENLQ